MSLIRVIQESGVGKDGLFNKAYDYEIENMKQIVKEKEVIIENNNERINELESNIFELRAQCSVIQHQLKNQLELQQNEENPNKEILPIMRDYEKFISEITSNYEIMKQERDTASLHLANLEFSFADLLEKYERAKTIVAGFQTNQQTLLNQMETYKDAIGMLHKRYDDFKGYANRKLAEAKSHVEQNDKQHMSELAKVKTQVLQSKVRISELEHKIALLTRQTNIGDAPVIIEKSLLAPLKTNFYLK